MASSNSNFHTADDQHQSNLEHLIQPQILPSDAMNSSRLDASGPSTSLEFNTFDAQRWQLQYSDQSSQDIFFPDRQPTPAVDNDFIAQNSIGFHDTSLHPLSSLSPSTAQDHLSPSNYGSDTAVYGDAFSDPGLSTPNFGIGYEVSQSPSMMDIQGMTSGMTGQFSSPDQIITFPNIYNHEPPPTSNPLDSSITSSPHLQAFYFNGSSALSAAPLAPQQPQFVITTADGVDNAKRPSDTHRRTSSKRSTNYLFPPEAVSSADDEDEDENEQSDSQALYVTPNHRDESGVWTSRGSKEQAGVNPVDVTSANIHQSLSLNEAEAQRSLDEKNAVVEEWLDHSEVGSSAEDEGPKSAWNKPRSRPRAKSTNDAQLGNSNNPGSGNSYANFTHITVPGPGLTLIESSEVDDYDDDESEPESVPGFSSAEIPPENGSGDYNPLSQVNGPQDGHNDSARTHAAKSMEGITAHLAMMRFAERAREMDSASVAATLGSRRLSESDIGSIRGAGGISKLLLDPQQQSTRTPVRRKSSLLEHFLPSRGNSQKLKRKHSHPIDQSQQHTMEGASPNIAPPKRIGSFGRTKSPKLDTNLPTAASEARSPKAVASAASGALRHIWRSRSRSDLSKPPGLGLAELMTQHGGPPMPTLASPAQSRLSGPIPRTIKPSNDDSGDEDENAPGADDGFTMDLSVRTDMHIIPTYDGFKYQVRQLNPRILGFLAERVTNEQLKRFKRLVELKTKHIHAVSSGTCLAKSFCLMSGGRSKDLPPRLGAKDPDSTFAGFQIMKPGMTEDDLETTPKGQLVAAQFPSGVSLPPVDRLPAEFECPLCFNIKKFYKPSDWTKHLHEDLQPFTCTFSDCNEPKSFKRKADWVRHENERHRQLEYWICEFPECQHTCYRKDNFVQHLVREHKVPEPRVRTGRVNVTKSPSMPLTASQQWQSSMTISGSTQESVDDVWTLVDKCHHEAVKQPKDEPCKFCGNVCTTWKKLTLHLAKHMEQIAMPVLPIVEQKRPMVDFVPGHSAYAQHPMTKFANELPTILCAEPTSIDRNMLGITQPDTGPLQSYGSSSGLISLAAQNYANNSHSLGGSSYPPPSVQSRSRGSSFHDQDSDIRQGTTYPPMGMSTHSMITGGYNSGFEQSGFHQQQQSQPQHQSVLYFQDTTSTGNANPYLTPNSGIYSHSPEGSMHDLQQTYSRGYQG